MVVNVKYSWIFVALLGWHPTVFMAQPSEESPLERPPLESFNFSDIPVNPIPTYSPIEEENSVLLENGYAQSKIKNSDEWPPQGIDAQVKKIEIVFTQYPKKYEDWITDYDYLLKKRLQALYELDPKLIDASIQYEIALQTDCESEFEAMQLFHGIRVRYNELEAPKRSAEEIEEEAEELNPSITTHEPSHKTKGYIKKLKQFMVTEHYHMDSTVYKILDRNEWKNGHLVLDWTGSMYGYGVEALLWHILQESNSPLQHITVFNDGDGKKNRKKKLGSTGGIYTNNSPSMSKTIRLIKKVKNKGNGGDSPENDIEALMAVARDYPEEDIILLADNNSCIRDYILLECLDRPVHIILSESRKGINHQYLNLAWKTGGSVHTKTLDIDSIDREIEDGSMQIGTVYYALTEEGRILPVDRKQDRFQYCHRYYRRPKTRRNRNPQKIECD